MKTQHSASDTARTLRVPFSRVYNAMTALGIEKGGKLTPKSIQRLVVELQQSAVPFATLSALFGENTCLKELAQLELDLVRDKYKKAAEPRKGVTVVDFTGVDDDL